jgi:hypothetical protein
MSSWRIILNDWISDLARRFGVKGFPTVLFWRDGYVRKYRHPRTQEGLIEFGKEVTTGIIAFHHCRSSSPFDSGSGYVKSIVVLSGHWTSHHQPLQRFLGTGSIGKKA